jgi:hypothetical protein
VRLAGIVPLPAQGGDVPGTASEEEAEAQERAVEDVPVDLAVHEAGVVQQERPPAGAHHPGVALEGQSRLSIDLPVRERSALQAQLEVQGPREPSIVQLQGRVRMSTGSDAWT